ncbi:MAG: mechanosensitive ion channel [Myxococcales bacterium FL481]|nr:MAG: mechanosensitive ion channel [Myxococcales bacterium FL481]
MSLLDRLSAFFNTPLIDLGDVSVTVLLVFKVFLFCFTVWAIATFVRRRLVFGILSRWTVDDGIKYAAARIGGYLVWVLGVLVGLPLIGIRLSSIMVALGAVGLGIGLGLQKIAENFVSGLILLVGRPIKVGDRIKVGDNVGTVVGIHARVTMVRTNDNVIILVPNAELVSGEVTNLTHNDRLVRFSFPIGVSYGSEPRQVARCLLEVAQDCDEIVSEPAPDVLLVGFGDSSLDFVLRAYCSSMVEQPEVLRSEINFAIWYKLKAAGIEIPFPQRDVHVKTVPAEFGGHSESPRLRSPLAP